MRFNAPTTLSIAALSVALALPAFSQSAAPAKPLPGERVAMRMVPAQTVLKKTLIASKAKDGEVFETTLAKSIHLDNGPELPSGTVLVGQIAVDDMKTVGTSRLALRFTQANLKDGTTVPIKATIVGVFHPEDMDAEGNSVRPGDEVPNNWNDGTLQMDQIDVISGVDLHSSIASRNSGVFVSTKKDDVQLPAGSEFALAIALQRPPRTVAAITAATK